MFAERHINIANMDIDSSVATKLIRGRRSIFPRSYSQQPVADSIIEEMLENANWAPTHKFTEPWRFVVFNGEGLKQFADFQSSTYKKHAEADGTFDEVRYQKLVNNPLKASHIIAVGMKRDPEERVPEIEEVISVGCAVHNMQLTAAAYGLGSYLSTPKIIHYPEFKPFLGLGENDQFLGIFYIGSFEGEWPKSTRKAIANKVKWVS